MSVKRGLIKNLLAGLWSRGATIIFRLVQVPLIVTALGVDEFGRWLVLYSLPSWLTLANMGFGSVASNEMTMSVANGDIPKARQVFSTTLAIITLIGIIGTILTLSVVFFIPWESFLKASSGRHKEFSLAALFLAVTVFVSFYFDAFGGRFRAARKGHMMVLIASFFPWLSLLGMIIALQFTKRFDYIAFSQMMAAILFAVVYSWLSRRSMRDLYFSFKQIKMAGSGGLFRKGLAFQAFPFGNALIFQGNIIIVQFILGPAAVALFGTVRTLVRTVNQAMEMINQAIWPEMSHLFGAGDLKGAAKLHRNGVAGSILLSGLGLICLIFFGRTFYMLWVGSSIDLPQYLLLLFLLPIPFNALWLTSSVVHMSSNQHEGLAVRYLTATILSTIACLALSYFFGLAGASVSTVVADIILIPYVLKNSLTLTQDTFQEFYHGVVNGLKELPFTTNKLIKKLKKG